MTRPRRAGARRVDVTVRAIAAGGAGVADLPDGRVVFVPRTAPGDRARIRVERSKPRWATGSLDRLLDPSPDRREAPCPLYDACGGCQLQHLPYERQLGWKGRMVADALERIAHVPVEEAPQVVPSPREVAYRSRVSFTLRRLAGGRVVAGFHALGLPGRIVDVRDECLLPERAVLDAWHALRAGWGQGARLLPGGGRLRLTLRRELPSGSSGAGTPGAGICLLVEGGAAGWGADALAGAVPGLSAIWHAPDEGPAPAVAAAGSDRAEPGPRACAAARRVAGSAGGGGAPAFEQVNHGAAALLRAYVLDVAGRGAPRVVAGRAANGADAVFRDGDAGGAAARPSAVDAYCGAGPYGRALAEAGWSVTGIERDPAACRAGRSAAPEGFEALEGRVEELLPGALPADLLLLNPPRTGLHPLVPLQVLDDPPPHVVYVSCDAATLARDLAALRDAYALRHVRCFDLFPQTAHVETVVTLERVAATP